jgi:hypothetical protein
MVLGIVLALAYLWRLGIWGRIALLLMVATGIALASPPDRYIRGGNQPPSAADRELLKWIDGHSRPPVILGLSGRWLAASSQAVAHVPVCTSAEAIDEQIRVLSPDYVIIRLASMRSSCEPLRDIDRSAVEQVMVFGPRRNPIWVLRPAQSVPEPSFAPPTRRE